MKYDKARNCQSLRLNHKAMDVKQSRIGESTGELEEMYSRCRVRSCDRCRTTAVGDSVMGLCQQLLILFFVQVMHSYNLVSNAADVINC